MAKPREAAVFAAITVILVSIPAASQNVEISSEEDLSGSIDSKFSDHFEVDFNPGKIVMGMVDSQSKFEVTESYNKKRKMLQTPEGYVEKVVSNDSITKTVQTPYGRFESGVENGDNFSNFEGGDREKAEEIKNSLEDMLEERESEAADKKQVVMSRMLPNIALDVEEEQEIEHFNLTNNGDEEVELEGWQIVSKDSNTDTMNLDVEIESGETLTYYSGDKDEVDGIEDATYGTGLTIYSGSGEVTLFNDQEKIVDTVEY